MKCLNCHGCCKIIRIDEEKESFLYWYCTLCNKAYGFTNRIEIIDSDILDKIRNDYKDKYGENI